MVFRSTVNRLTLLALGQRSRARVNSKWLSGTQSEKAIFLNPFRMCSGCDLLTKSSLMMNTEDLAAGGDKGI